MPRFFFGLEGKHRLDDPFGLELATQLGAYRAAKRLAQDLAVSRPHLRDNTWVMLTQEGSIDTFCVSITSDTSSR